jgi:hypothetical protein
MLNTLSCYRIINEVDKHLQYLPLLYDEADVSYTLFASYAIAFV